MSRPTEIDVAIDAHENEADIQTMSLVSTPSNEFSFSVSRTLARQLENMAKYEGISSIDLMIELVTEGIARRVVEDQTRPAPSHLMTRNGYVQDQAHTQPSMSHHQFQTNGNTRDNHTQARHKGYQRHNSRPQSRHSNQNRTHQNSGSYYKTNKKSEG